MVGKLDTPPGNGEYGSSPYETNLYMKPILRMAVLLSAAVGSVLLPDTLLAQPQLSIANVTVTEGSAGSSADVVLTVTLSAAATGVVTVAYATEPADNLSATGGASCSGNADYVTESGTVAFKPNETSRPLGVAVCGDTAVEDDERFRVRLSNPVGATIQDPTGRVTITNDDTAPPAPPALPSVSIGDVSVPEGNAGTAIQNATVRLSAPTNQSVTVSISALPGTATGGINCLEAPDFAFLPLPRTIDPGQTNLAVPFSVCGNTVFEPDETFTLVLRNPTNATLGDSLGQVTISNDDAAPAELVVELVTLLTQVAPNLAFGVRARNTGGVAASNVPVRFQLPKDVAFVGLEENTMGKCLQNSTSADGALQVNCTMLSLPAGGNKGVRILGKTPASAIAGSTEVVYSANIDPGNTIPEGNDTNNLALGFTTVLFPADLQVGVTTPNGLLFTESPEVAVGGFLHVAPKPNTGTTVLDFPDCFASGDELEVSLTVSNLGPNQTPSRGIVAAWPGGFVSSGGSCFEFCGVPPLNPGQSTTVALKGLYKVEGAGGEVITFRLDAVFDPTPANNTATLDLFGRTSCGG
jgi:hypothetical protein